MKQNYSLRDAFKSLEEIEDKVIETSVVISGPLTEGYVEPSTDDHKDANIKVFNISWDTDGENIELPNEFFLQLSEEELNSENIEEAISNLLSDQTGWLVKNFEFEKLNKNENLKEEVFSLTDDEGLKGIEEFEKEEDTEEPELTVVDTNADEIDEVASNDDAAGSFVFTCDKCGENIFRTLDELKTVGYERVDDTLFKLKNKDINMGEFYHCTKCGNDTFTGNKQIVLADIDAEVEGKPAEEENSFENVEPKEEFEPDKATEEDIVVEESLKEDINEENNEYYQKLDKFAGEIESVLDNYGITWGDIVDNDTHLNIAGVPEEEWEEAQDALKNELGLEFLLPSGGNDNELILKKLKEVVNNRQTEALEEEPVIGDLETSEEEVPTEVQAEEEPQEENKDDIEITTTVGEVKDITLEATKIALAKEEEKEVILPEEEVKEITDEVVENNLGINEEEKPEIEDEPVDEFDDVEITDIEEASLDEAISKKLSKIYENFGSYKTETAFLKDVENRIVLEGKLTFTSNKEQNVRFILEAVESDNGNIKFNVTSADFADLKTEINTTLTEGLLKANESWDEDNDPSNNNPEDFSDLSDYDRDAPSNIRYHIEHYDMLDPEKIEEEDEADFENDADGYIVNECSIAAWGGSTSNEAEKRLLLKFMIDNYPGKVKVLRKILGNENSSVDLDPDTILD